MERFGTAPLRNTYWTEVDEDVLLRDLMFSTTVPEVEDDDIESFEGIAFEIKDGVLKTSKGCKEFFNGYIEAT